MRPSSRLMPIAIVALSVFAATCGIAACGEECDDVGAKWCRGTQLRECTRVGGGGHTSAFNKITTDDCAEKDMVCSEETGKARCVFEQPSCADKAIGSTLCVGDVIAICDGASQPVRFENCMHCVESDNGPRCSPFPDRCDEGAAHRCEGAFAVICEDRVWSFSDRRCYGQCELEGSTRCVETTDSLGNPLEVVALCTGQPGIWEAVEPACESGCACEGEQTACRCREWPDDFQPF